MRLHLIAPLSNAHVDYVRLPAGDGSGRHFARVAAASIATVAAFAPEDFEVTLCDETIEPVDLDVDADVIGLTANVSQAMRALELAAAFRARGKTVLMGGPHVSLAPELFEQAADCLVVGEMEEIAAEIFADIRAGTLKRRYLGTRADLRASPAPRWDLYPNSLALSGVVQTSRGCPFECHFCDVIQYLGRIQRHKDDAQVLAEIQALYDHGYNFISLADDNFTVYRRRASSLLAAMAGWNGAAGREHVLFATQMSIDIARDESLLAQCNEAGLLNAFIGIETNSEQGLVESRKRQNLRVDLAAQCRKIVSHGIRIEAGLMVGFDSDDLSAFERQFEFAMSLPVCAFNLSVLVAPVATPLHESMRAAGRLVSDEVLAQFPSANLITNFEPAQMSRDELYVGAKWLLNRLMRPDYLKVRLEAMARLLAPPPWAVRPGARRRPPQPAAARAAAALMRDMARGDSEVRALISSAMELMRRRPDIRDGIADALTHYLMSLRGMQQNGVYDPVWAGLARPPFGAETLDARARDLAPRDLSAAI
ncbi:B12-binding domain-containing radical SAM protein [Marinicauda algicola]|uniref:B12-binding domain-containing radical SAM protein n=1 Tax=Marinicauda algicola TaxID=2029849 RepID=A0A4S2H1E5_9PROT|nr:B12-binding domain-containing radical SAM protein [Marinicauda algicola]